MQKKQQVTIGQLCQGLPNQFAEFLAYTRSLKFDAKPDMLYLRKLFRDLYHDLGCGQQVSVYCYFSATIVYYYYCTVYFMLLYYY